MQENRTALFDRDTLLHLRLPFSFFLLPVFCFGISEAAFLHPGNVAIVFIALHFFIYPGSNIYNSYMDRDKGSIGGLRNPPPVTRKLYTVSIIFDSVGLLLSLLIGWEMLLLMLVYVGISKAYSWHGIRLKKYGWTGWLVVMLFQGGYTFLLVNMASEDLFRREWFNMQNLLAMLIASLLIGGFYPLTQIYQHGEDSGRGDMTISYKLGIKGTFLFSAALFLVACATAWYYFRQFYTTEHFFVFAGCLLPVAVYFLYWFSKTLRDRTFADYTHAMRMTLVSSICMIVCFGVLFFMNINR